MTEPQPDFNDAFRRAAAATLPPPPDPRDVARRALNRNRRLTHFLAALCLLFWLIGCAGMIVHVIALNRLVVFLRIAPGRPWTANLPDHPRTDDPAQYLYWGTDLIHHSTPFVVASLVCLLLAAVCTVSLILASRRATLHRIHLTLAELSTQIKDLSPNAVAVPLTPEQTKGTAMRTLLILTLTLLTLETGGGLAFAAVRATTGPASRPWHGYPILSPFEAVRYRNQLTPEVQVAGTWYELLAFNDLPAADLVAACQSLDRKDWQKRFEEDLIEVLTRTGHTPPSPDTADLHIKNPSTG